MRVTLRCLASSIRPLVNLVTTLSFQIRSRSRPNCGDPKTMPLAAMSAASSMTLAACSRAFEGMQPSFNHTPPRTGQRSINVTLRPRSAARNAAVYPPTPAPSTTRSTAPGGAALALEVFGDLPDTGAAAGGGACAAGVAGDESAALAGAAGDFAGATGAAGAAVGALAWAAGAALAAAGAAASTMAINFPAVTSSP